MRILTTENIHHLSKTINFTGVIEKAALRAEEGESLTPERQQIAHEKNTHLLMPVYEKNYFSTSLLAVYPDNSQKNKETFQGMVSLNSGETGEPLCLLNGSAVRGLRMGGLSGCGIRHLAPADVSVLGIVGSGIQAYYHGVSILKEKTFDKILLFDPNLWKTEQMSEKLKQETKIADISVADDIMHLIMESNVIVTATNSSQPILPNDKPFLHGKTFIATGSFKPNMTELPKAIFPHIKKCIVDTRTALRESGDLIEPVINSRLHIDNVITLGQFIKEKEHIQLGKTRLFKTVGSALFDMYVALELYKAAEQKEIGTEIEF